MVRGVFSKQKQSCSSSLCPEGHAHSLIVQWKMVVEDLVSWQHKSKVTQPHKSSCTSCTSSEYVGFWELSSARIYWGSRKSYSSLPCYCHNSRGECGAFVSADCDCVLLWPTAQQVSLKCSLCKCLLRCAWRAQASSNSDTLHTAPSISKCRFD